MNNMKNNNNMSSFMSYTHIGGFGYSFEYKGTQFHYDLNLQYLSVFSERDFSGIKLRTKIASNEHIESKNKILIDSCNKHSIEIGQLYKCGEAIVLITDLINYNVMYCDEKLTNGTIRHLKFTHIQTQNLSTGNENGFTKHFLYLESIHGNGFHSLNSRTLVK